MQMWVICLSTESLCMRVAHRGFTLIELLVVLFIAGLLTAVVIPAMERMSRSTQLKTEHDAMLGEIGELGYAAFLSGKSVALTDSVVPPAANYPITVPDGWKVRVAKPITFAFNGICSGGKLTLIAPDGAEEQHKLLAPVCRIE